MPWRLKLLRQPWMLLSLGMQELAAAAATAVPAAAATAALVMVAAAASGVKGNSLHTPSRIRHPHARCVPNHHQQ